MLFSQLVSAPRGGGCKSGARGEQDQTCRSFAGERMGVDLAAARGGAWTFLDFGSKGEVGDARQDCFSGGVGLCIAF